MIKNIAPGLLLAVLASSQAFAYITDGRYKVLSANSVVSSGGEVRCFATSAFNTFGKVGEIVRVSITESSVIITSDAANTGEFISLSDGGMVPSRDQISISGTFGPAVDTFLIVNHETNSTEKVSVSVSGNKLQYNDERPFSSSHFPNGICLLEKQSE
jgi:hypothetical protein